VDGHGDPELDPNGVAQAARVAERLRHARRGEMVSAIYVTNLQRTSQTAAPLAAALSLTPAVEADLREVYLGEWEGGTYRIRLREGGPIVDQMMKEGRWDVVPGAEPDQVFIARIRAGIGRIAAAHRNGLVVVFTHGGVIGRIVAEAVGSRPMSFSGAENASITELLVTPERWVLRSFNDTAHLENL
jgi:probable phosphoglycerate mutase